MPQADLTLQISTLLLSAIHINEHYVDVNKLYKLEPIDIAFARTEISDNKEPELKLDALLKLFIAFFLEAIPAQLILNLTGKRLHRSNSDATRQYMLDLAGMLHQARMLVTQSSDELMPYLIAYKEFIGEQRLSAIADENLTEFFAAVLDEAIQTLITS